jgi:hypothetical protein
MNQVGRFIEIPPSLSRNNTSGNILPSGVTHFQQIFQSLIIPGTPAFQARMRGFNLTLHVHLPLSQNHPGFGDNASKPFSNETRRKRSKLCVAYLVTYLNAQNPSEKDRHRNQRLLETPTAPLKNI